MGRKIVSGHAGKAGRTLINGSEFCNTSYNWQEIAEEEETTSSCSAGHNEYEYGNTHIEGHLEADWDVAQNPFDDPPELRAGQEYAMRLYIHSLPFAQSQSPTGPCLECDNMKINNVAVTVPAKGKVTVAFDFKSSGAYSLPTGSDSSSGV